MPWCVIQLAPSRTLLQAPVHYARRAAMDSRATTTKMLNVPNAQQERYQTQRALPSARSARLASSPAQKGRCATALRQLTVPLARSTKRMTPMRAAALRAPWGALVTRTPTAFQPVSAVPKARTRCTGAKPHAPHVPLAPTAAVTARTALSQHRSARPASMQMPSATAKSALRASSVP